MLISTLLIVSSKHEECILAIPRNLEPNKLDLLGYNHIFHNFIELNLELATIEVVDIHIVELLILSQLLSVVIEVGRKVMVFPEVPEVVTSLAFHLLIGVLLLVLQVARRVVHLLVVHYH